MIALASVEQLRLIDFGRASPGRLPQLLAAHPLLFRSALAPQAGASASIAVVPRAPGLPRLKCQSIVFGDVSRIERQRVKNMKLARRRRPGIVAIRPKSSERHAARIDQPRLPPPASA